MYPLGYLQEGSLVLALSSSFARATRWLFCRLVPRHGRTIVELPEETIADLTKRLRRAEAAEGYALADVQKMFMKLA